MNPLDTNINVNILTETSRNLIDNCCCVQNISILKYILEQID